MNWRGGSKTGYSTIPLINAVLCVDCETISDSRHDKCVVCGSNSLFNLHRVLEGTLPRSAEASDIRYNLEVAAKINGISAGDVNQIAESMTRLLGSKQNGQREYFHINVESVVESAVAEKGKITVAAA